jgi:hypothetical protein
MIDGWLKFGGRGWATRWRHVLPALYPAAAGLLLVWAGRCGQTVEVRPGAPPGEMDLKAAFVLNFVRLTTWNPVAGEANRRELPVCALSNSDFASAVRQAVVGKVAGTRTVSFRFDPTPTAALCRVLVIDESEYRTARSALQAVRDTPVLTVGNGPGLMAMGGMFDLVTEGRKVVFEASLGAVNRAHLEISARLLQLCRNLRKGGSGGL